jgi:hypothetical protein
LSQAFQRFHYDISSQDQQTRLFRSQSVSTHFFIEHVKQDNEIDYDNSSELRSEETQLIAQKTFRRSKEHRLEARAALHNEDYQLCLSSKKDSDDVTVERHRSFRQRLAFQTTAQSKETSHKKHLFNLNEEFFVEEIDYSQIDQSHHQLHTNNHRRFSKIFDVIDSLCLLQREFNRLMHKFTDKHHRSRLHRRYKHSRNERLD